MNNPGTYIDLKNCRFLVQDAYSITGVVNNSAGYATGASTILVTFTGKVDSGTEIRFTGGTYVYGVSSTIETTGNTTTINLSSPLKEALTNNQGIVVGPHSLEVKIGEGNLTYDETFNREYKLNRGKIDAVRNGDDAPVDVNFQFAWLYLASASADTIPSIPEFFYQSGPAAAYVSTGNNCEPYAVNIVLLNEVPSCSSEMYPIEKTTLPAFRYEKFSFDAKAGTVAVTGKSNVTRVQRIRLAHYDI